MGSMVWSSDEARYLKAIFSWQDRFDDEQDGGNRVATAAARACVGDFRVLMIGAKGVGKTALLTRFCDGSFHSDAPPNPRFLRGGQRPLCIDKLMYSMDVLEMPSQHLANPDDSGDAAVASSKLGRGSPSPTVTPAAMMLEQAIAITEAAIVVYDVCNPESFQQARRLYERLRQERGTGAGQTAQETETTAPQDETRPKTSKRAVPKRKSMRFRGAKKEQQSLKQAQQQQAPVPSVSAGAGKKPTRPFALLLVGTKSDADDSERRVAWIDGSKAATPPPATVTSDIPPVPHVPGMPPSSPTYFLEASAKTGDNVTDVFVQLGREILRQRAERKRLVEELEREQAQNVALASGSSSATTNTSLLRIKSQPSATTAATLRTFGVLRVLGLTFGRRQLVAESPAVVA